MENNKIEKIFNASNELDIIKSNYDKYIKEKLEKRSVLSIDIIGYNSRYNSTQQSLIPYLLEKIFKAACNDLLENETAFVNEKLINQIIQDSINTGDGYILILPNPLITFILVIYIQANLTRYNSLNWKPKIYYLVRSIRIRYAATYTTIYKYNKKWYGPAMILNSRIINLDKLDHFFIDEGMITWFSTHTNGLETLSMLNLDELKQIKNINIFTGGNSLCFKKPEPNLYRIKSLKVQNIGFKNTKDGRIEVFNVYGQVLMRQKTHIEIDKYVISIGNLNVENF